MYSWQLYKGKLPKTFLDFWFFVFSDQDFGVSFWPNNNIELMPFANYVCHLTFHSIQMFIKSNSIGKTIPYKAKDTKIDQ
jgi:hypothetical protein